MCRNKLMMSRYKFRAAKTYSSIEIDTLWPPHSPNIICVSNMMANENKRTPGFSKHPKEVRT